MDFVRWMFQVFYKNVWDTLSGLEIDGVPFTAILIGFFVIFLVLAAFLRVNRGG